MATVSAAMAQTATTDSSSFAQYRQRLLDNYNSYRGKVLDNYDKFLDGVWDDFKQFKGEVRDGKPKPRKAPVAPATAPVEETPLPRPTEEIKTKPATKPVASETKPSAVKPSAVVIPKPQPQPSVKPVAPTPVAVATPSEPKGFTVDFYGMKVELPSIEFQILDEIGQTSDFAVQWRSLEKQHAGSALLPAIEKRSTEMGLNDYLKFTLVMATVNQRFAQSAQASRLSLAHYLLTHMGYDARIAMTDQQEGLLLLPANQMIYARPYLEIEGKRFYLFCDTSTKLPDPERRILTCRLPKDAENSKTFDLRVERLNLPYKAHKYDISCNGVEISGEVNANLFPVLYRYPQMDIADYAVSSPCPEVRDEIVKQVKSSLNGLEQRKAIDKLLGFIQSGFEYATDDEAHGFEKPYFFEEMLYYPQCDCEDRSIFYTYLLWNAMGVENHLLNYPGHESAAVRLDGTTKGSSYDWKGGHYVISDPTFIGAPTGMCMPTYSGTPPKIDYAYPEK